MKKTKTTPEKDMGVLYIRYDKNSYYGQLIEKLKQKFRYGMNDYIIRLIFFSEIMESLDLPNIDTEILCDSYFESAHIFFEKFKKANLKIHSLSVKKIQGAQKGERESPTHKKARSFAKIERV